MLSALDLRNGRTIYSYKGQSPVVSAPYESRRSLFAGISGAVSSVAPTPTHMASASKDRFVRLHSTYGPPAQEGQQQEHKGEVLDKLYMKVIPTVILWDGAVDADQQSGEGEGAGDDVWDTMEAVESDSDDDDNAQTRKEKKKRAS